MATRTKLVYQDQQELREYTSKVLSINPVTTLPEADQALIKDPTENDHVLITDETIFYVQGGGQPTDTGTITDSKCKHTFEVQSVRHPATGHQILHFGRFNPPTPIPFSVGDEIKQNIDAEKRELYSRLHTAGHVLGFAINQLSREGVLPSLTESKASHYPDSAAVEFGGLIDGKHKAAIQAKTDEFVKSAAKVNIHYWPLEELKKKCTGAEDFVLPDGEELGRVVEMEGMGSYPCGGTHVRDCSLVGKIEVKKISRSKGVSRVSYRVV
ncbi:ATP binding/alanine-tRNA ligase [Mollisia scopiformis]|uniref:ATP binding/alanine-tRNA ligase n=1 Tax=Mollisia scopiformis TaxID=149040 RepID=A0A194X5K1_MOLSC|nr:ATP binding/alanine-tRNA ligase [Mollisia scopiformis]KUJ15087.1 ATP binding/alanine-tRNA ligase [Mollisia scopiformis]